MTSAQPPDSGLVDWIRGLPELEGVQSLDFKTRDGPSRPRAEYRRRVPPGLSHGLAPREIASLVREDGVLRWRSAAAGALPGRRAGRAALSRGEVVQQFAFERIAPSQVYSALVGLDKQLTPDAHYTAGTASGLRRLARGRLVRFPDSQAAAGKKVLLIIHGTFSKSEALTTEGLLKTKEGRELLGRAEETYDLILTFDHPTLSVSPLLNAFDLAALLRPAPASVDIVCHSRGGLVARWFSEAYSDPTLGRRVVFVGAPLAGTSLAAAPRLKSTLDLLTNVADALRMASDFASATPLFLAASGILRVVGLVTGAAAKTPILDAAIALIPGLDAQSRTGNNQEIVRLRQNTGSGDFSSDTVKYFAIQSNFEPQEIGWNFLRLFSKPMQRLGDLGADIVFEGANDLVVDTVSMSEVADGRTVNVLHDFGTSDRVHHTNYFVQPETASAIRSALEIV